MCANPLKFAVRQSPPAAWDVALPEGSPERGGKPNPHVRKFSGESRTLACSLHFGGAHLPADGLSNRDYPLINGTILLFAATFVTVNLVVDVLYAVRNRRIRYAQRRACNNGHRTANPPAWYDRTMSDRTMERSAGGRHVPAAPGQRKVHATSVCGRCMAGNSAGETFCKVCGDELPAATDQALTDDLATRRIALPAANAQLIVHEDGVGSVGCTASLEKDVTLVGRTSPHDRVFPDVDLTTADPDNFVSRRHAFILRRPGGFAIEDLDSANGTFLNGTTRVPGRGVAALEDGDVITFGRARCTFRVVPPDVA